MDGEDEGDEAVLLVVAVRCGVVRSRIAMVEKVRSVGFSLRCLFA